MYFNSWIENIKTCIWGWDRESEGKRRKWLRFENIFQVATNWYICIIKQQIYSIDWHFNLLKVKAPDKTKNDPHNNMTRTFIHFYILDFFIIACSFWIKISTFSSRGQYNLRSFNFCKNGRGPSAWSLLEYFCEKFSCKLRLQKNDVIFSLFFL